MNRIFKSIFFAVFITAFVFGTVPAIAAETHTKYMTAHPATDPGANAKGIFIQSGVLDCNNTTYFPSGVSNGDVVQLVKVPINTIVKNFSIRITRADIKTGTSATVGDGASAAGFVSNSNTGTADYINFNGTMTGTSTWGIGIGSIAGKLMSGVTKATSSVYDNTGSYFVAGGSPYIGRDTIDMAFKVSPATHSSGVTVKFEWMMECMKLPTH